MRRTECLLGVTNLQRAIVVLLFFLSAVGSSIMALHDFSVQIGGDDDDQQSIDLQLLN